MGVRALIGQRLDALPEAALAALRRAAVIGDRFSLATLAQVTGRPREELLEALEQARDARLIDLRRGAVASYRFAHDLIRETAYEGTRQLDRARAHAAVGEALERQYAGAADRHLDELAYHFIESLPVGDPRVALDYATRAAEQALTSFAHERAARLYTAALETLALIEGLEIEHHSLVRSRLLFGLGRAQLRTADPRARETLLEAAAAARAARSPHDLAQVALAFGAFALSPGLVDHELTSLLEEALASLPAQDSRERANLLARLARALYWSPEEQRRRQLIDEAVAMARRLNDPESLAVVLGNCIAAHRGPDTAEVELGWIYELLALNRTPGELFVLARSIEVDLLLERGAMAAADAAIGSLEAEAERLRDIRARPYAALHRARRATIEGRWADAERQIAEVSQIAGDLEDSSTPLLARGALFMLRITQGRPEELVDEVRRVANALPEMLVWAAGLALIESIVGNDDEAQRLLDRLAAGDLSAIARNNVWLIGVAFLAEVCARLGDAKHAEVLHRELLPFAGLTVISPVNGHLGPVDRYLGLLEGVLGSTTAAAEHLRSALELARRERAAPMIAVISVDLAGALAGADAASARAEVGELLDEAERLAGELGLAMVLERAAEVRARLPRPAPVPLAPRSGPELTTARLSREGEMWRFEFEGRTVHARDSKGLRHVATLLSHPGVEIHALQLVQGAELGEPGGTATTVGELPSLDLGAGVGPALDDDAKAAYRLRIEDLREELDQAERWADLERASRARDEIDFIGRELAAAVGIGGRDRPQHADAERARVNVTRAIRTAVRRLAERHVGLGAELDATIRTGLFCRHEPDLRRPVSWEVDGG
jgi:hypothetical protein